MSNNEAEDSMESAFAIVFFVVIAAIGVVIGGLVWLVKHLM